MLAATLAAAAVGAVAAVFLFLLIWLRCSGARNSDPELDTEVGKTDNRSGAVWPVTPPESCWEAVAVTAATVRFAWGETLGKWSPCELAFGIKRHMRRQGNLQHEYAGDDCSKLTGQEITSELMQLLKYLQLCWFFSKKPFPDFLQFGGYCHDDVFFHQPNARLLMPAFALMCDRNTKCLLLVIRGATSTKDRLTAATAMEAPFHHVVLSEGTVSNVVLGHVHCGMVAAARCIAQCVIPSLHCAVAQHPNFKIKIIGHSMGASIGAILAYILREHDKFSSCTCIAFAPAACMTWELAEACRGFVTSLVNRTDAVPAFSRVSADKLHAEMIALSSRKESNHNTVQTRFFDWMSLITAFLSSRLPCLPRLTAESIDATTILYPEPTTISEPLIAQGNGTEQLIKTLTKEIAIPVESAGNDTSSEADDSSECRYANFTPSESSDHVSSWRPQHSDARQFFPPGRVLHMVAADDHTDSEEGFDIYETPRYLYGKIRLAPKMIKEHYMPAYVETMKSLISCKSIDL